MIVMLTNFAPWSHGLVQVLVETALRNLILAAAVGLALALFRVKAAAMRLFAWSSFLYLALAIPVLSSLLPELLVPVPSILSSGLANTAAGSASISKRDQVSSTASAAPLAKRNRRKESGGLDSGELGLPYPSVNDASTVNAPAMVRWLSGHWEMVAGGVYLAVAFLMIFRLAVGVALSRRLVSRSRGIRDLGALEPALSHLRSGIRALEILESDLIAVPVTTGTLHPAIVLPANWRTWNAEKIEAVIAHEISHVARRDPLTQLLSRLYHAVFWFNPLSWWLKRQIHLLAEEASDEAVLSAGGDRNEYAKTLLGFFESLHTAPGRIWWHGVSMAKAGQAEHRLERILSWRGAVHMQAKRIVVVPVIAVAIPAVYLVAAARPVSHAVVSAQNSETLQEAARAVAGVPAPPAMPPAAPGAPVRGIAGGVAAPAIAATPGLPPVAPLAPVMWSGQRHVANGGFAYAYGFDDEQRFVIVSGKSDSFTMSGSSEDVRHVQRLKKQVPGDFIWFQRDEQSYIIRDRATIDRARKLWAPQEELGKKQEELGKQQEALGKQQEELGAKMEQVRVNVPDMTAQLDALKAKLQKLGSTASMEQLGDLQSEIGELQSKIGDIQSHAGEAQGKFGGEMGALGEKQGKLGELQGELGRQQAELAERATKQMKELLDEAIKNGTAKPESESEGASL